MSSLLASIVPSRRRLLVRCLVGALALVCVPAASARAAGLVNTDPCDKSTLSQPFAQFGDSSSYKLVPGGDFEGSLAGWTLSGGATKKSALNSNELKFESPDEIMYHVMEVKYTVVMLSTIRL